MDIEEVLAECKFLGGPWSHVIRFRDEDVVTDAEYRELKERLEKRGIELTSERPGRE